MAKGYKNTVSKQLQKRVNQIKKNTVDPVAWQSAKDVEPIIKQALMDIVKYHFYDAVPESQYYERTYALYNSVDTKVTQGNGYYRISVWFDASVMGNESPSDYYNYVNEGQYAPYTRYKGWEPIRPLQEDEILRIVGALDRKYDFMDALLRWFNVEFSGVFQERFKKNLAIKIK